MNGTRTPIWRRVAALLCTVLAAGALAGPPAERVAFETNMGSIEIELHPDKAPITVANFLQYVDSGFYDGLTFHRVVANFVIQTGGYDATMKYRKPTGTISNESHNGLRNSKGTVAMARLQDPDSGSAQFFINLKNNPNLNFQPGAPGYTVFGRVSAGMNIVEKIGQVDTGVVDGMPGVPIKPVIIVSAHRVK
jgi:cyclophilin family peptidyl-prolyl cis-trans isomerase